MRFFHPWSQHIFAKKFWPVLLFHVWVTIIKYMLYPECFYLFQVFSRDSNIYSRFLQICLLQKIWLTNFTVTIDIMSWMFSLWEWFSASGQVSLTSWSRSWDFSIGKSHIWRLFAHYISKFPCYSFQAQCLSVTKCWKS